MPLSITKRSPRTGQFNTMEIDCTPQQYAMWAYHGELIQNAMPNTPAEQREFLMTGFTPEDWAAMFPEEDE